MSLFGKLLEKLKSTPDGDGTLLDHSTYLLGSGMGNPDIHDHQNLPIVVARGGAGGAGADSTSSTTRWCRSPTCI